VKTRPLLVIAAFAALAAWVSAQPATGPTAADYLGMMRDNRGLYEDLTRHALALGESNTSLNRADECRRVAARLAREVRVAVDRNDADRLAEVSDHLHAVTADGLAPNLSDAHSGISPRSPDYPRLREVHQQAFEDLTRTATAVPAEGKLGASRRAQAAREKLTAAAARIGPPPPAK
jgi:hypothetical protein